LCEDKAPLQEASPIILEPGSHAMRSILLALLGVPLPLILLLAFCTHHF